VKCRRGKWAGNVARLREIRNTEFWWANLLKNILLEDRAEDWRIKLK
jgi:hypothetical protein